MPAGSAIAYVGVDEQGRTGLWVQDFSTEHDTFETRRASLLARVLGGLPPVAVCRGATVSLAIGSRV